MAGIHAHVFVSIKNPIQRQTPIFDTEDVPQFSQLKVYYRGFTTHGFFLLSLRWRWKAFGCRCGLVLFLWRRVPPKIFCFTVEVGARVSYKEALRVLSVMRYYPRWVGVLVWVLVTPSAVPLIRTTQHCIFFFSLFSVSCVHGCYS